MVEDEETQRCVHRQQHIRSPLPAAQAGTGTEPHNDRSFPKSWKLNGSRLMSRAFVKDADYLEQLPERPVSEHPNDVTEAGLAQIEQALAAASEAYAAAQASTDRAAIAAAGRDLRYWSGRRATARVVPAPTDHSEVRFGTSVTIVRDDGREQTFRIVGEDEADPSQGSISHVSPLARSMFGKRVGDVVHAGAGEAEIIRIQ
jgi:transcription elongation GreA/GreB family factor